MVQSTYATAKSGKIRGIDANDGLMYLEPHHVQEAADELELVRAQMEQLEGDLEYRLVQTLVEEASLVDIGMQQLARLDVLFARAAFGKVVGGNIPVVGTEGRIEIQKFVHPVLQLGMRDVVPVDLRLCRDDLSNRGLIITGPNGGGKSAAMKSFGLATILAKLAIPIPQRDPDTSPRVDYYGGIVVDLGDNQSLQGDSTFMSRLGSYSGMLNMVASVNSTSMGAHTSNGRYIRIVQWSRFVV